MTDFFKTFDAYSRKARIYPALLTFLPLGFVVIAWYPALLGQNLGGVLLAIATSCGILFLLSEFARTLGKRIEPKLVRSWGGLPTTVMLRHREGRLSGPVLERYHRFLSERAGVGPLPSASEEAADPEAADHKYAGAIDWLREQGRENEGYLVQQENAGYGFRRNLLGLKPIGVAICAVGLVGSVIGSAYQHFPNGAALSVRSIMTALLNTPPQIAFAAAFCSAALMFWVWIVTGSWVREAADQYARALLALCDKLGASGGTVSPAASA